MQRALVTIVFCATFQLSAGERKDKPTYPLCDENQWLDITHDPPMCFPCTTCTGYEKYTIRECSKSNNTICSFCRKGQVWSPTEFKCKKCGVCSPDHQIQPVCLAANTDKACIEDAAYVADGPEPEKKEDSKKSVNVYAVAFGVVTALMVVIGIAVLIWFLRKRRTRKRLNTPISDDPTNDSEAEIPFSEEETGEANWEPTPQQEPPPQQEPSSILDEPWKENIQDQAATHRTSNTTETTL